MKSIAVLSALIVWLPLAQAEQAKDLDLEPCINGGVSASGTYVSDEAEALARTVVDTTEFAPLALEPCINAEASATGRYPNQMVEDILEKSTARQGASGQR